MLTLLTRDIFVSNSIFLFVFLFAFPALLSLILESFRFEDEGDYEYEIISILSIARAWVSFILEGKRDSRRHSTTGFSKNVLVVGTNYQM